MSSRKRAYIESMRQTGRLLNSNIPQLQASLKIGRRELYSFYILFKALSVISSQIAEPDGTFNPHGVKYDIWRRGIFQLHMMSEELAKRVYVKIDDSLEGLLDWGEFLKGMQIINAKTKKQMIDLFINLADESKTGLLDYQEMCDLSSITLNRYFSSSEPAFSKSLAEYFARFVFETCETPLTSQLKIARIRELIEEVLLTFNDRVTRTRVSSSCFVEPMSNCTLERTKYAIIKNWSIMAEGTEFLAIAVDKAKLLKDLILAQGITKLVFVGSAIALVAVAAYSFAKGDDQSKEDDRENDNDVKKTGGSSQHINRRGSVGSKKKRFLPERKFFTEEDQYSDEASTSNPNERGIFGTKKTKPQRFMSESEAQDNKSVLSKDIDVKVKEEADDLYFAMLNKLNK